MNTPSFDFHNDLESAAPLGRGARTHVPAKRKQAMLEACEEDSTRKLQRKNQALTASKQRKGPASRSTGTGLQSSSGIAARFAPMSRTSMSPLVDSIGPGNRAHIFNHNCPIPESLLGNSISHSGCLELPPPGIGSHTGDDAFPLDTQEYNEIIDDPDADFNEDELYSDSTQNNAHLPSLLSPTPAFTGTGVSTTSPSFSFPTPSFGSQISTSSESAVTGHRLRRLAHLALPKPKPTDADSKSDDEVDNDEMPARCRKARGFSSLDMTTSRREINEYLRDLLMNGIGLGEAISNTLAPFSPRSASGDNTRMNKTTQDVQRDSDD
ncbi:hypothetical protein DFH05DRAFT_1525270 [Lentinula detonsa]|uniref:Uncharacterized protein n=1 Tax=Lentinula detonsa TaxID=2804962 RepID=A0A9W8P069_9AGAR|nr:hypothetical protein DFH05DRAFT_1525270 [Lentinula detonsa]